MNPSLACRDTPISYSPAVGALSALCTPPVGSGAATCWSKGRSLKAVSPLGSTGREVEVSGGWAAAAGGRLVREFGINTESSVPGGRKVPCEVGCSK